MPQNSQLLKQILVIAATAGVIFFNWLAATGYVNGVTPEVISALHPTLVTPAGYAFMIWSLIYFGMIAFSIYQALPSKAERYVSIRSAYIFTCLANCGWIYYWHKDQILMCLIIISILLATLLFINAKLKEVDTPGEYWLVKSPFGLYFGWVTVATIVNFFIVLKYFYAGLPETAEIWLAAIAILLATFAGVMVRVKLANYFYPLAIAWAVTAIAVKHSSYILIVLAAGIGCIVSLFVALSFVLTSKSSDYSK